MFENSTYKHSYELKNNRIFCLKDSFVNPTPGVLYGVKHHVWLIEHNHIKMLKTTQHFSNFISMHWKAP